MLTLKDKIKYRIKRYDKVVEFRVGVVSLIGKRMGNGISEETFEVLDTILDDVLKLDSEIFNDGLGV